GIRDFHVTGVQTCALPIFLQRLLQLGVLGEHTLGHAPVDADQRRGSPDVPAGVRKRLSQELLSVAPEWCLARDDPRPEVAFVRQIGRAACRERWADGAGAW